ncbi:MAG TPA: hypothetical protein VFZ61_19830 [Polyangiales bacterium]
MAVRTGVSYVLEVLARPYVLARVRLISVCAAGLLLLHALLGDVLGQGFVPLSRALARHGLRVDVAAMRGVVAQRRGRDAQLIVFRAHEPHNLGDVWIASAVIGRDGRVAGLSGLHNLTRTSSADEGQPFVHGRWALCARTIEGEVVGLELFDLVSEPPPERGGLAKLQRGITNLQQTGRFRGIGKRTYTFVTKAKTVKIGQELGRFVVAVDGVRVVIDPALERPVEGVSLLEVRTRPTAVGDLVPWLVDTAREISWIGPERIAWLENKVFALRDQAKQAYHSVSPVDHAKEAAEDLGLAAEAKPAEEEKVERLAVPDPGSGWPPDSVPPAITPELAGEGKWRAIVDDPDARVLPDGKPVFYQTFLRADPERTWARVYLTLWDPRLVQLNIVAGTQEPISATGETGRGSIPRDKQTLSRLVGAFNGGFQAVHGEFGMMAEGRVYLPPKPWAATVAVFEDGRVGMGSWPGPSDRKAGYDEARAVAEIPAGMVAYRQNLTSLVEDGQFNPWGRWWWGAAPQQKSEQTLTQRSALCTTREGFMIYAWGDSASPEALGAALLSARCLRAMHLDMNSGHSGFEFYNVIGPDEARLPSGPRANFRFEGTLPELPGYLLRARKGVTAMGMPLPRYIHPDPRDYFYLTLKPGIETSPAPRGLPALSSADLPHAGWPPVFARTQVERTRLLRIDPYRAVPTTEAPPSSQLVLAELRGTTAASTLDDVALYLRKQIVGARYEIGVPPADAEVLLRGLPLDKAPAAQAGLGLDEQGLLVYVETDGTSGQVASALHEAGVRAGLALPADARLGLRFREGVLEIDGRSRLKEGGLVLSFVARTGPAVEVIFADTKPMPYSRWAQLQDQRVRYFRTGDPTSKAPAGTLREGAPGDGG